jgi:hypothetical protein
MGLSARVVAASLVAASLVAASLVGCGGAASGSSSAQSSTTPAADTGRATSNAAPSDDEVFARSLDECLAAADRNPEQRDVIRPVCLCVHAGGTEDAGLLRDLRNVDEPAIEARARACSTASRILPFVALDRCLGARPNDFDVCAEFAGCVARDLARVHPAEDFDAWFSALSPDQRRQLGADSATACEPLLASPAR